MKKNHTEILKKVFKSKKVLITGHTGFKGSWLSLCLRYLGANVLGISKNIPSSPSNFLSSNVDKIVKSKTLDIKKIDKIKAVINKFQPDFIFHLAAQSLVGVSYEKPLIIDIKTKETYKLPGITFNKKYSEVGDLDNITDEKYNSLKNEIKSLKDSILDNNKTIFNSL